MYEKLIYVSFMIIIFYLTLSSIIKFSNLDIDSLQDLINEFNQGVIEDLQVIHSPHCPTGYSNLFSSYIYPGNIEGCICPIDNQKFYQKCPSNLHDCQHFNKSQQYNLDHWRGKYLCIKRSTIPFKSLNFTTNKICNEGFKLCGKIDTFNKSICYPKEKLCPVSDLEIISKENLSYYNQSVDYQSEYLFHLNHDSYLYYHKKSGLNNSRIFSFFKVCRSHPCLYLDRYHSSNYLFSLQKNISVYGCLDDFQQNLKDTNDSIDTRYRRVDHYKLKDFFTDNNLGDLITKINRIQPNLSTQEIYLRERQFSGWRAECMSDEDSLHTFLETEILITRMLFYNILHSVFLVILLISLSVSSCFFTLYLEFFFKIISIAYCIVNIIYPIHIILNSDFIINALTYDNGLCSDNKANIILSNVINACEDLQGSYSTILIIDLLYCVIIIYNLYIWIKPYNQKIQNKYKKYLEFRS